MTDDQDDVLRARLAAADPMAGRPVAPLTPQAKERSMTTSPTATDASEKRAARLTIAASVAVVASGVAAALVFSGGDDGKDGALAEKPTGKKTVLQLTSTPGDPMAMCMPTTAETLRGATYAFEGTATSVEDGTVSLDVTHWYKGGDQQVVTLTDEGTVEDSTTFEAGKTYLVAAGEDGVGPCSGSGETSPEAEKLFDEAFGG